MEGYLMKWTNYVFGWQKRYFELSNGILSYKDEKNGNRLGTIHLDISQIFRHPKNFRRIYIDTGLVMIHLKSSTEEETAEWFEKLIANKENSHVYSQKNEMVNLISEKIAEINSIHAQILAEADLLSINVIKTTPGLERAIALCEEMKDLASETLGYIETQEGFITQSAEFESRLSNFVQAGVCEYEDTGTFVDARSHTSDNDLF
ncbi:hypothetical protein SteCoe_6634 [Stentor coeruleus]|uniref:PH domain-containing protein n=1 Tax=Stentor coeruleus TaxID=5963 RepID=A0A1R2CPF2_9CILI|nr:hypothetical protein SteCoe_6634 [Stentor coeruleus]